VTLREAASWLATACIAVAIGLGIAWAESAFAIPKIIVQTGLLTALLAALGFAGWAAYGYYRAFRDEDEWD
jgi:RsiW-degrading membrane proteinase PrsW (M82 family)